MKKPLISVVIPTYNHANFLENAINSLIGQEYLNWEAIIVDNHSTDNTIELINSFNDDRLKITKIQNNGIIAASRNKGIDMANGDWIAFLDSDDTWYPGKLKLLISIIETLENYDVISNDELMINYKTGEKIILRHGPATPDFYKFLLINGNRLSPSATIVRSSFLNENFIRFNELENYVTVEDYDFWLQLANKGAKFKFVNSIQGVYAIHSSNESSINTKHKINLMSLLQNHIFETQTFCKNKKFLWRKVKAMLLFSDSISLAKNKQYVKALITLLNGLMLSPISLYVYVRKRLERKKYIQKINNI